MHRPWRVLPAITIAIALQAASLMYWATAAVALSCASLTRGFAGNESQHTNAVRGAKASVEYVDEHLCTTSGGTDFSSFWVSVVGFDPNDDGRNIYQVGVDKCRANACVPTAPDNQSYYFWAYGRMTSATCGMAVDPVAHPKGNAGATTYTYKIIKEFSPGAGYFYNAYVGSTKESTQQASDLEACWNGVDAVQIANEVYNANSQSGGSVSNPQGYASPKWYDGSAWQTITGSSGSNCAFHDFSTMRCVWNDPVNWDNWDTRW